MKNKKGLLLTVVCIIAALVFSLGLAACSDKTVYTYRFVMYENSEVTLQGNGGDVEFPNAERDGYAFDGWYTNPEFSGKPITSGKFIDNVTLYAKWSPVYPVNIDLDGGSLEGVTDKVYIRLGANVATEMKKYVPTREGNGFGGWYVGDVALPENYTMTENGLNLVAKYTAGYKIDAYLQNVSLDGYDYVPAHGSGNALIGEEFNLASYIVKGYSLDSDKVDELTPIVERNSDKNLYTLYFNRSEYELVLDANYPDGSQDENVSNHVYGVPFDLPTDLYEFENSRFVGWSLSPDGGEIITNQGYKLENPSVTLYAVWNVAYTDLFNGNDLIYVAMDKQTAELVRDTVIIEGLYDEARDLYIFNGEKVGNSQFRLRARCNEQSGKFVYYEDRTGAYFMYDNGSVNTNITITVDNYNKIEYFDATEGNEQKKNGSYALDENGFYFAEFEDGSNFTFVLGRAGSNQVFRIRGEEYKYGSIAQMGKYYPILSFDGFGNCSYIGSATQKDPSIVQYIISDNRLVISMGGEDTELRLFKYKSETMYDGFEVYNKNLDIVCLGNGTITLDGCSNATYSNASSGEMVTVKGKFAVESSLFGGNILTITAEDDTVLRFHYYYMETPAFKGYTFEQKHEDYAEYYYISNDLKINPTPLLVINGDKVSTYEPVDEKLVLATNGTLTVGADGTYTYVVTEKKAAATTTYKSFKFRLDTVTVNRKVYKAYYMTEMTEVVDEQDKVTDYITEDNKYTRLDGEGTLKFVAAFAIYTNSVGTTVSGLYSNHGAYISVAGPEREYFFILHEDTHKFELLTREPIVLTHRTINPDTGNPITTSSITLTLTGRQNSEGAYEAIYIDARDKENIVRYEGYATEKTATVFGTEIYYYQFDAGGKSFKYSMTQTAQGTPLFMYYELSEDIRFTVFTALDDDNYQNTDKKLTVTDAVQDGKPVLIYTDGTTEVRGTVTEGTIDVFGSTTIKKYTFTPIGGGEAIDFTLSDKIFRVCAPDETFHTSNNEITLELNGSAHVARITIADKHLLSLYIVDNYKGMRAFAVQIGDTLFMFDVVYETDKIVELRGNEAHSYIVIDNGTILSTAVEGEEGTVEALMLITLDGHGNAVAEYTAGDFSLSGTYKGDKDGKVTITLNNGEADPIVYEGRLGIYVLGEDALYAFYLTVNPQIVGAYLDKASLAVLTFDSVGNVKVSDSYGVRDTGSYIMLEDDLLYFVNDDNTHGAMYTVDKAQKILTASTFAATYYAKNFASIVFYRNGVVLVENDKTNALYFKETAGEIFVYERSEDPDAKFGYKKSKKFEITEATLNGKNVPAINYNGKTFYEFDGKYVNLTDANGAKLVFQPTGEAQFTAQADYTPAPTEQNPNPQKQTQFVVVSYNENGEVQTNVANYVGKNINGSKSKYSMFTTWDLSLDLETNSFVFNPTDSTSDFVAYHFMYLQIVSTYGEQIAALLASGVYGEIAIVCNTVDGVDSWSVVGAFNHVKVDITGDDGEVSSKALSFTDGKLLPASIQNQNYGNLFICEFVGNDGKTYHLKFYLLPNGAYLIYSLSCVTGQTVVGNAIIYNEEFVYNSNFNIKKDEDEEGNPIYYKKGDAFIPMLSYNGELCGVITADGFGTDATSWELYTIDYTSENHFTEHFYTVTLSEGVPTSVTRYTAKTYSSESKDDPQHAGVLENDAGEVQKVYAVIMNKTEYRTESSVKNEDGTFTVGIKNMYGKIVLYTVTFTTKQDEHGESHTYVTITEQPTQPEQPDQPVA